MTDTSTAHLHALFAQRYGEASDDTAPPPESDLLQSMAARGSCRRFQDAPVPMAWVNVLCKIALASPSKSDLQQRDIIVLRSPEQRRRLADLIPAQPWISEAPMLAVFCGNNRRQRLLHDWHDTPFANDHLDAFFNAVGDAAIALGAFVTAAEALGLGCCPISAVRNAAVAVGDLLELPDHVFPFAGLAFGWPKAPPTLSMRLPLKVTCHVDRYDEADLEAQVAQYDAQRAASQSYQTQRAPEMFGQSTHYCWSEDKVRQYAQPERAEFGAYIRAKGFKLD